MELGTIGTIILAYLFIGLLLGLLVEQLAKIPDSGIAEILGNSLGVRISIILLWPIVAVGVLVGISGEDDSGPTITGT